MRLGFALESLDSHSLRIPSTEGIADRMINKMLAVLETSILWVNPDHGLKTSKYAEVKPALLNMVTAAKLVRAQLTSQVGGSLGDSSFHFSERLNGPPVHVVCLIIGCHHGKISGRSESIPMFVDFCFCLSTEILPSACFFPKVYHQIKPFALLFL